MATREILRLAKVAALSAGVTMFAVNDFGLVAKVEGHSMQPAFNPSCGRPSSVVAMLQREGVSREDLQRELKNSLEQDRVVLNKLITRDSRNLKVGDVVIFVSPTNPTKSLIKRIVAMPGDRIMIVETGEIKTISEGFCWVEGDNQQSSYDSHEFGPIPLGLVLGRVCFIIWPWHRIGRVDCEPEIVLNSSKTKLLGCQLEPDVYT